MNPMNPALTEMVARARVTEMRQAAAQRAIGGRRIEVDLPRPRRGRSQAAAMRPVAPRRAIGWFLVSVGLRLALPRPTGSGR